MSIDSRTLRSFAVATLVAILGTVVGSASTETAQAVAAVDHGAAEVTSPQRHDAGGLLHEGLGELGEPLETEDLRERPPEGDSLAASALHPRVWASLHSRLDHIPHERHSPPEACHGVPESRGPPHLG